MNSNQQKATKILRLVILIGLFSILFLPLVINSGYFFPFIVFRNVLFRVVVEILLLAYVILAVINPQYRPRWKNPVLLAVLGFFIASVISTVLGIAPLSSVWGNYERMSGLFHLAHLVAFLVVIIHTFQSREEWDKLLTVSVFMSIVMSLIGLAQWLNVEFLISSSGGSRLTGTIGNAAFLAAYLLFNLFFVFYFLVKSSRFNLKTFVISFVVFDGYIILSSLLGAASRGVDWGTFRVLNSPYLQLIGDYPAFYLALIVLHVAVYGSWFFRQQKYVVEALLFLLFILQFFVFFNTQTRGGLIGMYIGLVVATIGGIVFSQQKRIKQISVVGVIILVFLPPLLYGLKDTVLIKNIPTLNRLAEISLTDLTTESRLVTWQASYQGWIESPKSFLFGYGPENYYYAFNKHFPQEIFKDVGSRIWFDRAHNIVFDVLVTTGAIGGLMYLAILGAAFWILFISHRRGQEFSLTWFFISLIVAYVIQNLFVFDTLNSDILWFLTLGFIGSLYYLTAPQAAAQNSKDEPSAALLYGVGGVGVVALGFLLLFNYQTLQVNQYLKEGLTMPRSTMQSYEQALNLLRKSIDDGVIGKIEARQQLGSFALDLRSQDIDQEFLRRAVATAVEKSKESLNEEPLNVRHYLWLASLYNGAAYLNPGYIEEVFVMTDKAQELSPTRSQVYFERAQAYIYEKKIDEAIAEFERGIDIAPWVLDSHIHLLSLGALFGREDVVAQEYAALEQWGWVPNVKDYNKIVQMYLRAKDYDGAIAVYEKMIELEPRNPQIYADLALVYGRLGQNNLAKAAIEKILEIDGSRETQAAAADFIKKLEAGEFKDQS